MRETETTMRETSQRSAQINHLLRLLPKNTSYSCFTNSSLSNTTCVLLIFSSFANRNIIYVCIFYIVPKTRVFETRHVSKTRVLKHDNAFSFFIFFSLQEPGDQNTKKKIKKRKTKKVCGVCTLYSYCNTYVVHTCAYLYYM